MEPVLNGHHLITKCHFISDSGVPLPTYLPTYLPTKDAWLSKLA